MACIKIICKGDIHGVGFRAATVRKAKVIGAFGFVQNESDGSVTILVCGTDRETRLMKKWIVEGETPGLISSYKIIEYPEEEFKDFTIHY